jgi:hypothetical protein
MRNDSILSVIDLIGSGGIESVLLSSCGSFLKRGFKRCEIATGCENERRVAAFSPLRVSK